MKTILATAAILAGLLQSALGYSLGGPIGNGGDAWQSPTIDYGVGGDLNAPKNLGQGYRRNTPVMYYTYDQDFWGFFGSSGIASVDGAFTVLNQTFTNSPQGPIRGLDGYSANLSEFPLESRHINYQAQALGILDLKSLTLGLMTEQLGLTDPVRWTWAIHDRYLPPGGSCPASMEYLVVQRNFDYISSPLNQLQYSPYVNDTLYSYYIYEYCTPPNPLALTVPYSVDPLADIYSPVASFFSGAVFWGDYYSGFTRDDVAGLRYLLQTNNVQYEDVSADSLQYVITTNTATPTVFPPYLAGATNVLGGNGYYTFSGTGGVGYGYGDLSAFLSFATTNGPAALQAAYPGIVISSVSNSVSIASNATYTIVYIPPPVGSPYGTAPVPVLRTNYSPFFLVHYYYTFANIFTNHYTTSSSKVFAITVSTPAGAPVGSPGITNVTVTKVPGVGGDFFVLPLFYTNVCPIDIIPAGSIAATLSYTNGLALVLTNSTTTNLSSEVYEVSYFTNYSYAMYPVTCSTIAGAQGEYQGIEKIQFVKVPIENYDTLTGQFITPLTNNYTLTLVTNTGTGSSDQLVVQYFQRIVTAPDILFSARDLTSGPGAVPVVSEGERNLNFDTTHVLPRLAGPGTITSPTRISFNDSGPVYYNSPTDTTNGTAYFTTTPDNLINEYYELYFVYGSFDGTTNTPTVFPDGTSILNLENQMLTQISPSGLANGALGQPYPAVQFTASGGSLSLPYTWSASGLPDGLSLSPGGLLSGTPTSTGTYNSTLTVTDPNGLTVQWVYTFTIQ